FFVPEHGTMFTLALVRFPPTATKEIQYLNAKGALTYTDIAGDPVLYGNLPPREISMKDVSAVSDKLLDLVGLGGKSAADKGKDTRDYLAAAFPELNAWERAGADASSAGMVDAGFENQKELT